MEKPKVLIVEDDAMILRGMRDVLTLFGIDVVGVAGNVSDALRIAENIRPDLAIFDIRLRGRRDGIEGVRLLRERFDVPVVLLTANTERAIRARAAKIAPAACLTKPAHPQHIIAAIERALKASRAERTCSTGHRPA